MAQGALDGDDFALVTERDAVSDKVNLAHIKTDSGLDFETKSFKTFKLILFAMQSATRLLFALHTDAVQRDRGGCAERSRVLSREGS